MNALFGSLALLVVAVLFQIQPLLVRAGVLSDDALSLGAVAAVVLFLLAAPLAILSRTTGRIPLSLYVLLAFPLLHLPVAYFTVPVDALIGGARLATQVAAFAGICAIVDVTRWTDAAVDRALTALDWLCVALAAAVVHSYFAPGLYENLGEVQAGEITRAFGITGDQAGWIMAFVGIVAFTTRRWFVLLATSAALVATGQVGASVMFLVGCLAAYVARGGAGRFISALTAGAVAIALAASLASTIPLLQRLNLGRLTDAEGSGALRLYAMSIGVDLFQQSPIVGSGYGTYVYRAAELYPIDYVERRNYVSNSTNQLLQFLYEFGAVFSVVVIYLGFVVIRKLGVTAARAINLDRERARGVFWAVVALVVCNQSAVYFLPSALFALVVTYICLSFVAHRAQNAGSDAPASSMFSVTK